MLPWLWLVALSLTAFWLAGCAAGVVGWVAGAVAGSSCLLVLARHFALRAKGAAGTAGAAEGAQAPGHWLHGVGLAVACGGLHGVTPTWCSVTGHQLDGPTVAAAEGAAERAGGGAVAATWAAAWV
ncbi:hypothetical protein V8C86DRAFT_2556026 [Haematococcus lacustris]